MSDEARDPFEQLERSHRRLEERLEDLAWTAREARGAAADVDAIRDVAAFFARAVRRHEEDEESSLFPRLRTVNHDPPLAPLLARITDEHREHVALHAQLDAIIARLDAKPDDAAAIGELASVSDALTAAYRSHVAAEEETLFPAARAALDATTLATIAREMQERRGGGGGGGRGGGGGGGGGGGRGRAG